MSLVIAYAKASCTTFLNTVETSSSAPFLSKSNVSLFGQRANWISFFTSWSVTFTLAHWLNIPSNWLLKVSAKPIILCAFSIRCFAPEVCLIRTTLVILRSEALRVFWQTIRIGVKAAVILPLPSCEVVRKIYFSVTSSPLPTRI
ncbi:hypothetical protein D3C86_1752580 [compost metagenome]